MTRPILLALFLTLTVMPLGSCGTDANPVRDLAVSAGITGGEPKPAPDFVTRTRSASVDYRPVGVSAPPRARVKDATGVSGAETEMNELRTRNESRGASARRAGASPPPAPVRRPPE